MSEKDLGFGNSGIKSTRFIDKEGNINVHRKGLPFFRPYDIYHDLITMSWGKFILVVFIAFFLVNLLFAAFYSFIPFIEISGVDSSSGQQEFWDHFFFSVQTCTTLGYGTMSPISNMAKVISAAESFMGLVAIALTTGLLYGRFSNPSAKVKYSKNILIAPFQDGNALMFKMANQRSSKLIEAEVTMSINYLEDGKRQYKNLPLQLKKINFFALTWTVVHPINESSPLHNFSAENLEKTDAEVIILVKAFDDTFSQTVYSRMSYKFYEFIWNAKFESSIMEENGQMCIDLDQIDAYEKL